VNGRKDGPAICHFWDAWVHPEEFAISGKNSYYKPVSPEPAPPNKPLNLRERLEVRKLQREIVKLSSETNRAGTFSRLTWPILSSLLTVLVGILTVMVSFSTYRIQQNQTDMRRQELFFEALKRATEGSSIDARIAGVWAVGSYWSYEPIDIANTLAIILATGPDYPEDGSLGAMQILRLNAGEVMGIGVSGNGDDVPRNSEREYRARLLFGNGRTGERGSVTRLHWYLREQLADGKKKNRDVREIELKLLATKWAIRRCWRFLEGCHFGNFDLSGARLYDAHLRGTFFGAANLVGADLHGADLRGADFDGVDLRCADLHEAQIKDLQNWKKIKFLDNANLYNVVDAPEGFRKWALGTKHAVELGPSEWSKFKQKVCIDQNEN
jgi:hypothetical protein